MSVTLDAVPEHGIHTWLLSSVNRLRHHLPPAEVAHVLVAATRNARRRVPAREIDAAIRKGFSDIGTAVSRGYAAQLQPTHDSQWPRVDAEERKRVTASGFTLADIWEASPIRCEEGVPSTDDVLDALFPADALLCCAADRTKSFTVPRERLRQECEQLQFIVPSPMLKPTGRTQDGRESARCLDNVGPRSFLVVECDSGTIDEQAAILGRLADFAPLVLAVHSGGKSLHGWFNFKGQDESIARRFFRFACRLGADPATWTRCQLVRMPGGRRESGDRQVVWFFNPGVAK